MVWRGIMVEGGQGAEPFLLSVYYFLLRDYDPLTLPVDHLDSVAFGHPISHEDADRIARHHQQIWNRSLVWDKLKNGLKVNELASNRELRQLAVHYRFLSACSHPFSKTMVQAVYGTHSPDDIPRYDHYASEPVLLYICYLAAAELRAFIRMLDRAPRIGLENQDAVVRMVADVERLVAYFWPPGSPPHDFDRIQEANQRYFDAVVAGGTSLHARHWCVRPEALAENAVRYYRDPLRRLIGMHSSSSEATTGFAWVCPWPRRDALLRS